jgi:hypothetical protein
MDRVRTFLNALNRLNRPVLALLLIVSSLFAMCPAGVTSLRELAGEASGAGDDDEDRDLDPTEEGSEEGLGGNGPRTGTTAHRHAGLAARHGRLQGQSGAHGRGPLRLSLPAGRPLPMRVPPVVRLLI